MKKILVAAAFVAWAGTLLGAYVWGGWKGPPDGAVTVAESRAALCSIAREEFQDANRALDKVFTVETVSQTASLPLRAWGRTYRDSTNANVKALVEEADFQERRRLRVADTVSKSCFAKD